MKKLMIGLAILMAVIFNAMPAFAQPPPPVVPEPSTIILLAIGVAGIVGLGIKNRKK